MNERKDEQSKREEHDNWNHWNYFCDTTVYLMDNFGPRLTLDMTRDRQRYVLRIHCMNLHEQEAHFVSFTLQFERLGL
jgi:hypothetical protein